MDWHASMITIQHGGAACRIGVLLVVFLVGPSLAAAPYRNPLGNGSETVVGPSAASTVEVLRNIQKILSVTKSLGIKHKFYKQAEAEAEGAANALAYLTDSFGGQLAGQILSVILASVTGDVRGILGNSLNLFQTDERRDRVQLFLDEISQNFLKVTGLGLLTTTKAPAVLSTRPPILISGSQLQSFGTPVQAFPVNAIGGASATSGVGSVSSGGGYGGAVASGGGYGGAAASGGGFGGTGLSPGGPFSGTRTNTITQLLQQRQQQIQLEQQRQKAQAAASSPIIYVLPSLSSGSSTSGTSSSATGTTGSKLTTGTKATTATGTGADDDSEEDRRLWRSIQND